MKKQKNLLGLSKIPLVNKLHTIVSSFPRPEPRFTMGGYLIENWWQWLWKSIRYLGNGRYEPYPTYTNVEGQNGIFPLECKDGNTVTIALLADWASYTMESQNVAKQASNHDYSIHLGDTYYVGTEVEIADNFNDDKGANGTWPYGKIGSFALLGNHEMYSNGDAYFKKLLPYMGIYKDAIQRPIHPQQASFFCLQNDYWRIIGLDTGYFSVKGRILGINDNEELELHELQKKWLEEVVKLKDDKRGIIFLSHHQYISSFTEQHEFFGPAKQLAELMGTDRPVIWFCGHEHRLAIYGLTQMNGGISCFPRCIGNSGMPVEIADKHTEIIRERNLVLFDKRFRKEIDECPLGYNGHVVLKIHNEQLTIEYYDDNDNNPDVGRKIIEEKWTVDINTGKLQGSIEDLTVNADKKLTYGANTNINVATKNKD